MEICNVALIVAAAIVFNAVSYTEQSDIWTSYIYNPNGTIENLNLTVEPEDSPRTPAELKKDVLFVLFTKLNQTTGQELYVDDIDSFSESDFNCSNPTIIVIHGWHGSIEILVDTSIRDAYLSVGAYNVILVDWSSYASQNYLYARFKVMTVGEYVGQLIDCLVMIGCDLANLTVVGHSLGAHIGGVAARSANGTVANLVGMDPAGPLFYFVDTLARMRPTDAGLVEVIHTCAGRLGYCGTLGHVDHFVNGGFAQPGCKFNITGYCDHFRSTMYFAESIYPSIKAFTSYACGSYADFETGKCDEANSSYMGGSTLDMTASGTYYLDTNSKAPFARGNVGPARRNISTLISDTFSELL